MLEVVNYNYTSTPYNLSIQILNKIKLSSDIQSANREELFIKDICKRVSKSKSVLYVLEDGNNIIGLFSMSATNVKDQPSAQIDYIFVNKLYRGKNLEVLENYKPFRYLISLLDVFKYFLMPYYFPIY